MKFMDKLRYALSRYLYGRYGVDQFGRFLFVPHYDSACHFIILAKCHFDLHHIGIADHIVRARIIKKL